VKVDLEPVEGGYRASFDLPRGSYATVVMGELTKSDADLDEAGE
jgi:tRNA pseudouridine13 synthase